MAKQQNRKKKKKKRTNRVLLFTFGILGVLVIAVGTAFAVMYQEVKSSMNKTFQTVERVQPVNRPKEEKKPEIEKADSFSILLLGIDTGDKGRTEKGRSDTMMVATLNPEKERTTLVSIPRDLYTAIAGTDTSDKINSAYTEGGAAASMATVENLLDIPLDHYVELNMKGLKQLIDAIGGITVNSPLDFTVDEDHFKKGPNKLNGEQALEYIRMRYDDPKGDFGRQQRQRDVITVTLNNLLKMDNILKYQQILQSVSNNMKTDLTWENVKDMVGKYRTSLTSVNQYQLEAPGGISDGSVGEKGIYYEHPTKKEITRIHNVITEELH